MSYSEVLILFEQWAGHGLLSEKVVRPHVREQSQISISSVLVSKGIEIRQGRASSDLWLVGRHFSTLRHLGWGKVFSKPYFKAVRVLPSPVSQSSLWTFGTSDWCSSGASGWHLDGTLELRHCTTPFFQTFSLLPPVVC